MLQARIVAAALTAALSLVAMPESYARGGFARMGGFAGPRIGGFAPRPFVGGIRPVGVRPFIGPRIAFHRHRRLFPIFPLAVGAGFAYSTYPYCDPYYYPCYYDTTYLPLQSTVTPDAVAACTARYRTYDQLTHTFISKGGVRRPCP